MPISPEHLHQLSGADQLVDPLLKAVSLMAKVIIDRQNRLLVDKQNHP